MSDVTDPRIEAVNCAPPKGTLPMTYHWIERESLHPARWVDGGWKLCGQAKAIAHDQVQFWRYIGPCIPPKMGGRDE